MTSIGNGAVTNRPISSVSGDPEAEATSAAGGDPTDGAAGVASLAEADEAGAPDSAAAAEAVGPFGWRSLPPSKAAVAGGVGGDCASIKSVRVDLAGSSTGRAPVVETSGLLSVVLAAGCAVSGDDKSLRDNVEPAGSVATSGRAETSWGKTTGEMGGTICGRDCRSPSLWSVGGVTFDTRSIDVV